MHQNSVKRPHAAMGNKTKTKFKNLQHDNKMTTHERQMLIPKGGLFGQVGLYTGFGKKKIARSNPEKRIIELK